MQRKMKNSKGIKIENRKKKKKQISHDSVPEEKHQNNVK